MFISQVIFETERANEEMLKQLLQKKKEDVSKTEDMLSSEFWWKESSDSVGFAFVAKWRDKKAFQDWLKQSHAGGNKVGEAAERPKITKIVHQFKLVE